MSISWAILSLNRVEEGGKARKASIISISWTILSLNGARLSLRTASILSISWAILLLNRVGKGERGESPEGRHHQHQLGHPQSEQGGGRWESVEGHHHEHQLGHPQSEQGGGRTESPEGQHYDHQLGQSQSEQGGGEAGKAGKASNMSISWAILILNRVAER